MSSSSSWVDSRGHVPVQSGADANMLTRLGGWLALVAALVLVAFAVVNREVVLARAPQTALIFKAFGLTTNVRGIAISAVTSRIIEDRSQRILVIEGTITNVSRGTRAPAALRFGVTNDRNHEIYHWTIETGIARLDPGGTAPFRARLVAPPSEGHAVTVRFINRDRSG